MTPSERHAIKTRAIERHLARVEASLPASPEALRPMTAASDAVTLHLWQAVQIAIDLAVAECAARRLGTPADYASAFRLLGAAGALEAPLVERLVRAVVFRNVVAHDDETLDLARLWVAGREGPSDLRAFLRALGSLRCSSRARRWTGARARPRGAHVGGYASWSSSCSSTVTA